MQTRRQILRAAGTSGVASVLAATTGCNASAARASAGPPPEATRTDAYQVQPLPFKTGALDGLSERLIRSHHENNYAGAVRKLNAARTKIAALTQDTPGFVRSGLHSSEAVFKHSVVLHEFYFGNLGGDGRASGPAEKLIAASFGGFGAWERSFGAMGRSLGGGSGWVVLQYDFHERSLRNYLAADHAQGLSYGEPLVVLDMYEHAYHLDFGAAAAKYVDAFFRNLSWDEVNRRLEAALKAGQ